MTRRRPFSRWHRRQNCCGTGTSPTATTRSWPMIAALVDRMKVVAPLRPSRWEPSRNGGRSIDLRRTLRAACRTGGDPVHLRHRRRGQHRSADRHAGRRLRLDAGVLPDVPAGAAGRRSRRAGAYLRLRHPAAPGDQDARSGPAGGRDRQGADDVARRVRWHPDRGGGQDLPGHRRPPRNRPRGGGGRRLGRLGAGRSDPAGRADGPAVPARRTG